MAVETHSITMDTKGETDIIDITPRIREVVEKSAISDGQALVFVSGSTAGITTVEYEPGLVSDLEDLFELVAPRRKGYAHDARWGDGNGYAHVRASLLGSSLTVPFTERTLLLGTWQQVICIDFDNRPRKREIIVQITGDQG
jgi:secondary thiamine-phosphate synthase enzyme